MSTSDSVRRFSALQIFEHIAMMVLFTALCVTGFPQKFFSASASQALVEAFGGVAAMRLVHRISGLLFTLLALWHLGEALLPIFRRKANLGMVATRKDFTDAVTTLRYYLGLTREQARFDRFDYRQKFEYWGLVMGTVVMVGTGLILLFPILVTNLLPGQIIPASKVMHGSEGLMAFLVIIIWHIYNAHLSPEVFPFDTSIFTGRISRHRMEREHPLELERLDQEAKALEAAAPPPLPAPTEPPPAEPPVAPEPGGRG
ncbi:MAG: cytochrome C [Archangium sp.]|nr:cytochrome C [Archangium sp.]